MEETINGKSRPDKFKGLRTKWLVDEILKKRDGLGENKRYTVEPFLGGMNISNFIQLMEKAGANLLEINLQISRNLLSEKKHKTKDLRNWRTTNPIEYRKVCANFELTRKQWVLLLIDFLKEVKSTNTKIKFIVHQRNYINRNYRNSKNLKRKRGKIFISDMIYFINKARSKRVDSCLLGIRLGEAGIEKNKDVLITFPYEASKLINEQTSNWLKNKHFMMTGGGTFGADFTGIKTALTKFNTTHKKSFFESIKKETGSFSFSYKHFVKNGIRKDMITHTRKINDEFVFLDAENKEDWIYYIKNILNFKEVRKIVWEARQKFPKHANVVFVGDSGDSFKKIGKEEYEALLQIFNFANQPRKNKNGDGGFNGIHCVEGITSNITGDEDKDNFKQIYFASINYPNMLKNEITLHKNTQMRWKNWPNKKNPIV